MAIPATLMGKTRSRSMVVMRSSSFAASGAGSFSNSTARLGSRQSAAVSSLKL